ncbi:MAG: SGNH/GDSL hydrolase family protein, partial [Candidatus Delongbacteria bacterium]
NLKAVFISTTFVDFSAEVRNISVDYGLAKKSVKYNLGFLPYIFSIDLRYMLKNYKVNSQRTQSKDSYYSLSYDKYGGAVLEIPDDKIDPERWNNNIADFDVGKKELDHLASLINFLSSANIKTVIAVPPQREGLMNDENIAKIIPVIERIRLVAESNGAKFINSFEFGLWPDSLFVDYCHLNKAGSVKYTEYIVSKSGIYDH